MSQIYSRAYLHHLFKTEEILGYRIATQHNLYFYIQIMDIIQKEIRKGSFKSWATSFISRYNS